MVLAQVWINRPMDINNEFRNRPMTILECMYDKGGKVGLLSK